MKTLTVERRDYTFTELRVDEGDKPMIRGYAAVFNKLSEDLFGFREKIEPGAFKKTLKESDVRALLEHDPRWLLGNAKSGTLRLEEDDVGLRIEIDPPATTAGRDAVESLRRGDLTAMSFAFRTIKDVWAGEVGNVIRTLLEVQLYDVSIVAFPAYPDTSVALRSAQNSGFKIGGEQENVESQRIILMRKKIEIAEKEVLTNG